MEKELRARSNNKCELCSATNDLSVYEISPAKHKNADDCALLCATCLEQIEDPEKMQPDHWRCLNDSMWSEVPAVKILAWRILNSLRAEVWPIDLLDMLYMEEEELKWAQAIEQNEEIENEMKHLDANGTELQNGDKVILIKDLKVKGASFTAKCGTTVRRISLVADNPEHIEGKVNNQFIVILTKYVKKVEA